MFNWDDFINGKVGVSFNKENEVIAFLQMVEERGLKLVASYDYYVSSIFNYNSYYILYDTHYGMCYTARYKEHVEYIVTFKKAFNINYPSKTELMDFLEV